MCPYILSVIQSRRRETIRCGTHRKGRLWYLYNLQSKKVLKVRKQRLYNYGIFFIYFTLYNFIFLSFFYFALSNDAWSPPLCLCLWWMRFTFASPLHQLVSSVLKTTSSSRALQPHLLRLYLRAYFSAFSTVCKTILFQQYSEFFYSDSSTWLSPYVWTAFWSLTNFSFFTRPILPDGPRL